MKNKKVRQLLAASAIAGSMLTMTGCSTADIIDNFNPMDNIPMPAYGMVEDRNLTGRALEDGKAILYSIDDNI